MNSPRLNRRRLLVASAAGMAAPYVFTSDADGQDKPRSKIDRFRIGAIGMHYQGTVIAEKAQRYGDIVAICDVDRQIVEKSKAHFGGKADLYEDYRKMLERKDIDVIMIGTPDHWHTAMVIDACRAGKDVYCEKPLTLTVDEGKLMSTVVKRTGRVLQVGSWQRSDHRFRLAVEMVQQGRLGNLRRVDVVLGKNKTGGPFQRETPPPHLNWDLWQGQTPDVPYVKERSHYTFRWWYEYSGGQMTDWGAHHVDIGQWGIGSLPVEVRGRAEYPKVANGYNVAISYSADYIYGNGVVMTVKDSGRIGVMFTGTKGRIFVNRRTIGGRPFEELEHDPLPREKFQQYAHDNLNRPARMGKLDSIINHMGNFFDCVKSRNVPISDVISQHRSATTCHIGNIAMHLRRPLGWDPIVEQFTGDDEANRQLSRRQRTGYELEA